MLTHLRQTVMPLLLACAFLALQGVVYPHMLEHVSQHAHHDPGVHGTVACAWLCAAGQDLGPSSELVPATISVIVLVDDARFDSLSNEFRALWVSRGPPASSRS